LHPSIEPIIHSLQEQVLVRLLVSTYTLQTVNTTYSISYIFHILEPLKRRESTKSPTRINHMFVNHVRVHHVTLNPPITP
jgi:hypothetical protein